MLVTLAIAPACGGDDDGQANGDSSTTTAASSTDETMPPGSTSTADPATTLNEGSTADPSSTADTTSGPADTTTTTETTGTPSDCDFEAVDGMIVIEAESLPIVEDWQIQTTEPGYYGDGYIVWAGASHNGDPTHGVMQVTIHVAEPGRYRLQWRNRIGMGSNTTEHNDSWFKLPDAADSYGLQMSGMGELRRYPRPRCEDADAMAAIEALPEVASAACVEGASADDWFKVYSSGADDWRWSTRTNDNDAHDVMMELAAPGDYTFMMAARGDWHLVDRIVIHQEGLDDAVVQDPAAVETACR